MGIADVVVIVILIAIFFLVARYLRRRRSGSCDGCRGCCPGREVKGSCPNGDVEENKILHCSSKKERK